MGRVEAVTRLAPGAAIPGGSAVAAVGTLEVILPLEGLVDLDAERARLEKEIAKKEKDLNALEKKLSNQGFVSKAPAHVVEGERKRRTELAAALETQRELLTNLSGARS